MNTLVQPRMDRALRQAFLLDAMATGGMGCGLAVGADVLQPWLGLPVVVLREAGILCVAFALYLAFVLSRTEVRPGMVRVAIGVNVAWILASFALLAFASIEPTVLGTVFVIAQALTVFVFTELQYLAAKRASLL